MTTDRPHPPAAVDTTTAPGAAPLADLEAPVSTADPAPAASGASHRYVRDAELSYLGVAIAGVLPPLAIYLADRRRSAFARGHAAEALRVSAAVVLYGICALILAAMLALDSITVAAIVVGPLIVALWLVVVSYLVRAARAAGRGEPPHEFPSWLRVSPRR
jgi:hypothetical protein